MNPKLRGWLVSGSAVAALVGAVVTIVYFYQPWRSCDYEDTSAGCAMLPADATVMAIAMFATLAAMVVFALALMTKDRSDAR
jgi:hypothetical protein